MRGSIRDVHSALTVARVRALFDAGATPGEIARDLELPVTTVRHWCVGTRRRDGLTSREHCPKCHGTALDEPAYAHLLGFYLGDGHITVGRRGVAALSIYCADEWPGVRAEAEASLRAVMPTSSVSLRRRQGCREVKSYSKHWLCLFPQHGPGTKHTRPIVLAPWQRAVVERHPERLVRGLFHSDGCRNLNWARKTTPTGTVRYEYVRYLFSNKSEDIMGICESALDLLGVPHRRPRVDILSVARREGVARLEEVVGPKY